MTMFLRPLKILPTKTPLAVLQEEFLLKVLPRVRAHAQISFRFLRCPHLREDAIAECEALGWKYHLALAQRGKDATQFVSLLATYAVRHVKAGRRVAGQDKAGDAMSRLTQQRRGFKVEPLPISPRVPHEMLYGDPLGQQHIDALEERLGDNTQTPVPDQAAFRIDYPIWLRELGHRNREIAEDMALSHTTKFLATRHKISEGRISQLRREFHQDWRRFHGEDAD